MAWWAYYINCGTLCDPEDIEREIGMYYRSDVPPHGSVRREWTTRGMKHGEYRISFVEYRLEDDDPDGVWEAYGMKQESEYSFTVEADNAHPDKLFVYTLYKDGTLKVGFDIDVENARVILTFPEPQDIVAQTLQRVAEKVEQAPRMTGTVEAIVQSELLSGNTDTMCLAFFYR